jgi:hypothetical protein
MGEGGFGGRRELTESCQRPRGGWAAHLQRASHSRKRFQGVAKARGRPPRGRAHRSRAPSRAGGSASSRPQPPPALPPPAPPPALSAQERLRGIKTAHGSKVLGEVTVDQALGGMRAIPVSVRARTGAGRTRPLSQAALCPETAGGGAESPSNWAPTRVQPAPANFRGTCASPAPRRARAARTPPPPRAEAAPRTPKPPTPTHPRAGHAVGGEPPGRRGGHPPARLHHRGAAGVPPWRQKPCQEIGGRPSCSPASPAPPWVPH